MIVVCVQQVQWCTDQLVFDVGFSDWSSWLRSCGILRLESNFAVSENNTLLFRRRFHFPPLVGMQYHRSQVRVGGSKCPNHSINTLVDIPFGLSTSVPRWNANIKMFYPEQCRQDLGLLRNTILLLTSAVRWNQTHQHTRVPFASAINPGDHSPNLIMPSVR